MEGVAVVQRDFEIDGHGRLAEVLDVDVRDATFPIYGRDGVVELPGLKEPGPPEPVEVLPAYPFERVEQVVRSGVFKSPGLDEGSVRLHEGLFSEDSPKGNEHGGGFRVGRYEVSGRRVVIVGPPHDFALDAGACHVDVRDLVRQVVRLSRY